jgi:hypothetical protein
MDCLELRIFPIGLGRARVVDVHVLGEALEVLLLLLELLLELHKLLLLTLADGVVLAGTLSALESVAIGLVSMLFRGEWEQLFGNCKFQLTQHRQSWGEHQYRPHPSFGRWWRSSEWDGQRPPGGKKFEAWLMRVR